MFALSMMLVSALFTNDAMAARPAMDPQVRAHLGASATQGPEGYGLMGGMDSRLTRVIYIDLGGMLSPISFSEDAGVSSDTSVGYYRFRHAIYVSPGLRIPHRQPDNISWDILLRAGAAVVWSADLAPDAISLNPDNPRVVMGPAGLAGVDLVLRKDHVGLRGSVKGFGSWVYSPEEQNNLFLISPQFGVEALYQF